MRRTPQYKLPFQQTGDIYSASADRERMVVTDNQLHAISRIVGDGVLDGWTVAAAGGLDVQVSRGSGFISAITHSTLSDKTITLVDNATSIIYMRSNMFGTSGGFPISVEGPPSNRASASFSDTTPPADPTNLSATASGFNVVNLTWDANSEPDIDHYVVQRAEDASFSVNLVTVASPEENGTVPNPLVDSGLSEQTTYYYRCKAVDKSGNESGWSTSASVTTPQDLTQPTDPLVLRLYPGDSSMGVIFEASPTQDVTSHELTCYRLKSDGSIDVTYPSVSIPVPTETYQVSGLTNGYKHRFVVKAVRANGVKSNGILAEQTPYSVPAPLDVMGLSATPTIAGVQLSWSASLSPTGSSIGQKSQYRIYVIDPEWNESAPLTDVGLATSRLVSSYFETAAVGLGERKYLEEGKRYGFRVTTVDPFGNENGGALIRATALDVTAPTGPRNLNATPGDGQVVLTWNHSITEDVVSYELSYGVTTVILPYVTTWTVSPLPNGVPVSFSLKAKDGSGNSSTAITATTSPEPDTTPPPVPEEDDARVGDESITYSWAPSPAPDFDHFVVWRREVFEPVNTPPNLPLTTIAGTELYASVSSPQFLDVGLVNGNTYAYAVKAVDSSGNESDYTGVTLSSPSEGMNNGATRIGAPTSLTATPGSGVVTLAWSFSYPGQYEDPPSSGNWVYPSGGPTNFNVYRSTQQYAGYEFLASIPSSEWTYVDPTVRGSQSGPVTYWYVVTAVRDNASPIADTGSLQPAHSIPLATVVTSGGAITSITNEPRIVQALNATLTEETNKRLLVHKHSVSPTNLTSVTAIRSLAAIDASTLASLNLSSYDLSDSARAYYEALKSKTFTTGTSFTISPEVVTGNIPKVGDFQFLVSGGRPNVSYVIDEANNLITLSSPVDGTKTFDGQGVNFYVPALLDLGYRGFDVRVDGVVVQNALADEASQVVRMASLVGEQSVVTVAIEPTIPDFGTQQGARQVSLSPNIVLNDFVTQNQTTYTSESGAFDDTDTVFAMVNGARTSLDYYVDFITKSIVFGTALPAGSSVALEIVNREEVQGLLPARLLSGLDASQFKTGKLLKAQLPALSHAGRIKERAWPVFSQASTSNWYVFPAEVGTGTTPYSFVGLLSGGVLMGTSSGMLRSYLSSGILVSASDDLNASSELLSALPVLPSALVAAAEYAAANKSGRLRGIVSGVMLPSACVLQDGRVLLTGGGVYDSLGRLNLGVTSCSIYDPVSDTFSAAGQMSTARIYHTCTLLPDGKVIVTGGKTYPADAFVLDTAPYPDGLAPAWHHASCEVYDPVFDTWMTVSPMATARYNHSANLLPDSPYDLVVAGGTTVYNPASPVQWDQVPASPTTTGYTDERYWVKRELSAAERMTLASFSWSDTGALNDASEVTSSVVEGSITVTGARNREVYDAAMGTWAATTASLPKASEARVDVTEPIKQLMIGSDGFVYAVSRNSVYVSSDDGVNYIRMSGLDAVGVVHKVIETTGRTLMAATDIGVYVITPDIRSAMTWFAGGLIGAGTTETFDLVEYSGSNYAQPVVLASTEIGIYETGDDAETWSLLADLEDVRNIEASGGVLYATAGKSVYRSADSITWSRISVQEVITESSVLLAREGLDLLLGTTTGLYWSQDGIEFSLVAFDRNRDPERNAVFMLQASGDDAIVGFEDSVYSIDALHNAIRIAEFGGVIPTVRVDGEVARGGYRYDVANKQVVFEFKRLAEAQVEVASSYELFAVDGGWYHQNPDAPVQVYVSGKVIESGYALDPWSGKVVFEDALSKFEPVTMSIYGTTLSDDGELLHEELEDGLEREKGLPLSLGRDREAGVLQMGVSIEHNFLERGVDRNQYYCFDESLVDRSFNAFLKNAEFYIMGRREFDRFNSTIDYAEQSSQPDIGESALVPYCVLEWLPDQVLVGTDAGIFMVDPTNVLAPFSVTGVVRVGDGEDNPVYDLKILLDGQLFAVTRDGLYVLAPSGSTFTSVRNAGNGLPDDLYVISAMNNMLVVGASDGIYYAESNNQSTYETWYKASLIDSSNQEQPGGPCVAMTVNVGMMFAGVGKDYYTSVTGKTWTKRYEFAKVDDEDVSILKLGTFAEQVFALTDKGLYADNGSSKSNTVSFVKNSLFDVIETQFPDAKTAPGKYKTYVGDLFVSSDSMHVVGPVPYAYKLQSGQWTYSALGADSAHKILVTSLGRRMAVVGNIILVE